MSKNMSPHKQSLNSTMPNLSEGQLETLFRRLNLAHTRRIYQDLADRAEKENWGYRDFLALLLAEEVAHRKQTRLQRFTRKANFPFFKTIDEFDFSLQTTLRLSLLGSYLGPDFVSEGRSLIFCGKAGRGKTHLAVAIGYRAIQNGFETLCINAAELVEELSNASKQGRLQESLLTYTHPHVLIVDEVGYLTYGPDAANVLFHVVNNRHLRKRPMIFTTNKPFSEWGKVLHDEDLAAAILDRILERGRVIHLDGPSWRTRHLNLEEPLPPAADRARISGIGVPEFSEPTRANPRGVNSPLSYRLFVVNAASDEKRFKWILDGISENPKHSQNHSKHVNSLCHFPIHTQLFVTPRNSDVHQVEFRDCCATFFPPCDTAMSRYLEKISPLRAW
jgi:DNA replication protein DnaC